MFPKHFLTVLGLHVAFPFIVVLLGFLLEFATGFVTGAPAMMLSAFIVGGYIFFYVPVAIVILLLWFIVHTISRKRSEETQSTESE